MPSIIIIEEALTKTTSMDDCKEECSLTIVYSSVDACGFNLNDSTHPVSVESVLPDSPAAVAGLLYGDRLLMVNGHDVSRMPLNKIQSIISYSRCSPVTIKVVRDTENVASSKPHTSQGESNAYKKTVDDAFKMALDAVSVLSDTFTSQQSDRSSINSCNTFDESEKSPIERQPEEISKRKISNVVDVSESVGLPPPIPQYKPKSPDTFMLSNKPEYQLEVKKQRHWYEEVELDFNQNDDQSIELEDPLGANIAGLPSSVHAWKKEHVLKWLQQLHPILYDRYKDDFSYHDITGHTMLHLNQSKLMIIGVNDQQDRMQLGMSIAKLCLVNECKDLEKLSDHGVKYANKVVEVHTYAMTQGISQLQWMEEYTVSTEELFIAANKLPRDEESALTNNSLDQGEKKFEEQLDSVCDNKPLPQSSDEQLSYAESPVQNVSLINDGKSRTMVDPELALTEDDLMQLGSECLPRETSQNAKVTLQQQNARAQSKIATTTLMIGQCFSRNCKENAGIYKARGKNLRNHKEIRKMRMVSDRSENALNRYSITGQIDKTIANDVKLPPIPKSPVKPKRHITPGFQIPNTITYSAVDTYSSRQTIRKGRPSRPTQSVKPNFVLGNDYKKANNIAFLQLSPFSGSAMSYSSAMSKNLSINTPDRNGQGKTQLVPFRHVSKALSPSSSKEDMPANTTGQNKRPEGFPSLVSMKFVVAKNEMKQDQVDILLDNNALRRKRIQKHATLIEIDDHDKFDDSHLVKFDVDEKMKGLVHKLRGGVINTLDNLTDEIRDEYEDFLTQIDEITYYQLCQAESVLVDYSPRLVVVISSSVPQSEILSQACRPEVLTLIYDVSEETYSTLLEKLRGHLDTYMKGSKMKNLALITKGGPGYMYLLKKSPVTPQKLLKERELLRFWKDLGRCMSKISPSTIHLMESNVAGNVQGEMLVLSTMVSSPETKRMLLKDLEAAMYAHKVKVESPLEFCRKGKEMINTYFFPEKFKDWKQNRYKGNNT